MTLMPVSTPRGEEIRKMVETRLKEAHSSGHAAETVRIELREEPIALQVIKMPVADLYYNPHTNRVRVQRAHEPHRDAELQNNPFSQMSQEYLHDLLRAKPAQPNTFDPDFEKLRDNLRDYNQNDPGIITRSGVLVNGNTRRAALRDLNKDHIRVAVLPADATWGDISAIELELQLRTDHKREYSYINRLVAINDMTENGQNIKKIAKEFRTNKNTIERDQWVYSFITEAVHRSKTKLADGHEASLRLMDFEGHKESLAELHKHQQEWTGNESILLKESRLLALLVDLAKTKLRYVKPDFHDNYLAPKLDDRFLSREESISDSSIPGFDAGPDIALPEESDTVRRAQAATDALIRAKVKATVSDTLPTEEKEEIASIAEDAKYAVERAAAGAEAFERRQKRKDAAAERLSDAVGLVEESTEQVALARSQDLMQHQQLDDALLDLAKALKQLSKASSRGVDTPGEGLAWLQRAVSNR